MPHRHPFFGLTVAVLIALCFGATPSAAQSLPDVIVTSLSYVSGVFSLQLHKYPRCQTTTQRT
jgi:hypothetical protein